MSKMSLKWHEECLHNMEWGLTEIDAKLDRVLIEKDRLVHQIEFYKYQIEEAKRTKKDSFDKERFRVGHKEDI